MPDAVYRDLIATLFTMTGPVIGFGVLYALVGLLVYLSGNDAAILALVATGACLTVCRALLIRSYHKSGGANQTMEVLKRWERRYAVLTYAFAALIAILNLRVLSAHQPLVHLATVSLIFTFGAGIVSRNAGRPRLCLFSQAISVLPVAAGMIIHATAGSPQSLHAQFFLFEGMLLIVVALMSIGSVRHLYRSTVDHLTTKHDLATLARFDPLTGLANRLLVREAFQAKMTSCLPENQVAVHYLDLDGFKAINDQFGHPAGDRLLVQAAQRLTATIRSDDVVARLGGDEFLVLQPGVQHPDQAQLLARRMIKQLSEPYSIEGTDMRVSVSIGIALAPTNGLDLDHLMECADGALYRSKAKGKAQVHFCDGSSPDEHKWAVA
jgi:diguanylate cyclase (GGDEF)-like protein